PAIGVAAAYGLALAGQRGGGLDEGYSLLSASRPAGGNLRWGLGQMRGGPTPERARALHEEEVERCKPMARHAAELVPAGSKLLTHCNTGALATGGYGSALGAIRAAWEAGRAEHAVVGAPRPPRPGAR